MSNITLIVLLWKDADIYPFNTFLLPSMARFLCSDAIESFIIIYKTSTRPMVRGFTIKIDYIPYSHAIKNNIKTKYTLYLTPHSFFFRPCFHEDLITPKGPLLSRDTNALYYTEYLPNDLARIQNINRRGVYNTTTRNYLSFIPKNIEEIKRNYNGFIITLPKNPAAYIKNYLKKWLEPQVLATKQFNGPRINTLEFAVQSLSKEKIWLVSIGGVASNYLYSLLGSPMTSITYQLLCHYPKPLKIGNPGLRAIFLFDDIYHALHSQFNRGFQVPNIRKISNRNYNKNHVDLSLQEYTNIGIDLFELSKQFDAWTNPKNFDHAICCIKTSALPKQLDTLLDFLEITGTERARIKKECKIHPFKKSSPDPKLQKLYGSLDAKIKAHPDFVIHTPKIN